MIAAERAPDGIVLFVGDFPPVSETLDLCAARALLRQLAAALDRDEDKRQLAFEGMNR